MKASDNQLGCTARVLAVIFAASLLTLSASGATNAAPGGARQSKADQQAASATQQSAAATQQAAANADPISVLSEMLGVACRQDAAKFPDYLMGKNAAYYRQLSSDQQVALLRRLVLLQGVGHPLLSTEANGHILLRCETSSFTGEIRFGVPRLEQALAFVPVMIKPDRQIDFGLIRTSEGWKLLSVGVLMLDLQQLQPEWDAQEMADREDDAIKAMYKISAAIDTYRNAFKTLPESLAQLGPAPKDGISPDAAGLLDADMVSAHVGGYTFHYRIVPSGEEGKDLRYELSAAPDEYGKTGRRSFFVNATGKLRGGDKAGAAATAADPLLDDSASSH